MKAYLDQLLDMARRTGHAAEQVRGAVGAHRDTLVPAGNGAEAWQATVQASSAVQAWQRYLGNLTGEVTQLARGFEAAAVNYSAADQDAMRGHPWTKHA
ncbi:hypothetical protein AB0M46_49140 [Dactylosporangium sp. NPDC051485]|uniref:hypothetical protein n=1 Tax=Dactylosporangium sp. NPDC051485 TaxID=3154846 RepID=UPI00342BBE77